MDRVLAAKVITMSITATPGTLRILEASIVVLSTAQEQLADILYDYQALFNDELTTGDYDTLDNARVILENRIEVLRKEGVTIANKLKHVSVKNKR